MGDFTPPYGVRWGKRGSSINNICLSPCQDTGNCRYYYSETVICFKILELLSFHCLKKSCFDCFTVVTVVFWGNIV